MWRPATKHFLVSSQPPTCIEKRTYLKARLSYIKAIDNFKCSSKSSQSHKPKNILTELIFTDRKLPSSKINGYVIF